jgi:hypothetical protein
MVMLIKLQSKLDLCLSRTVAFIEATEIEEVYLREKYSDLKWEKYSELDSIIFDFQSSSENWYDLELGVIDERPIVVRFRFCLLNGKLICFWEPVSVLVDYELISKFFENWLKEYGGLEFGAEEFERVVELVCG